MRELPNHIFFYIIYNFVLNVYYLYFLVLFRYRYILQAVIILTWSGGNESESEVTQSCLTLCDPVDCNLLGFSVHGILQARILEWIAIPFSRGSSQPRDRTRVSHIGGRCFNL